MIMSVPVDINLLLELLKDYVWPRPDCCPECGNSKVWGHGFVNGSFDFSRKTVPLRRYRCPNCGCVIRLRPEGYFKRFQASIDTIRRSIHSVVATGKAIKDISRQRQRHWFSSLERRASALLGMGADLIQAFEKLIADGVVPVAHLT